MPSQIDNYKCIRTLGKGISAKVKLAETPDGKKFAIKVFDKSNPQNNQKTMEVL
jgi:hypothetical protein